jgi:hypothetical protein
MITPKGHLWPKVTKESLAQGLPGKIPSPPLALKRPSQGKPWAPRHFVPGLPQRGWRTQPRVSTLGTAAQSDSP